jgi:hypothetical protein
MFLSFCCAAVKLKDRVTLLSFQGHTQTRSVGLIRAAVDATYTTQKNTKTHVCALIGIRTCDHRIEAAANNTTDRTASIFNVATWHSATASVLTHRVVEG